MSSYRMKYKIGLVEHSVVVPEDMSSVPIGTILPYGANSLNPPFGFLWCDGSAVSRSMYPDLFELIGTLYGSGDGSTTFNLPNLLGGRFLEGTDSAGTSKNPGLPNITGVATARFNSGGYYVGFGNVSGAFYNSGNQANNATIGSGNTGDGFLGYLLFDASRSSSVYGNSTTVQPKSLTIRYIIRAYTGASQQANLDLSVYASDLATRLQRQQVPAFNRRVEITTSQSYSAPVTGWYKFTIKGAGGGGSGSCLNSNTQYGTTGGSGGEGGTTFAYEKMNAGDIAVITIGAGGSGGAKHTKGSDGGNTTVVVNSTTYTGGGGYAGTPDNGGNGGAGNIIGTYGTGRVISTWASGANSSTVNNYTGSGFGRGGSGARVIVGTTSSSVSEIVGNSGSNGGVVVEYFDPTL